MRKHCRHRCPHQLLDAAVQTTPGPARWAPKTGPGGLRSRDLRSTIDLDLIKSSYTYFDAYPWEDLKGTDCLFCSGSVSSKVAGKKTPWSSSATILTCFTPVTSFLTSGQRSGPQRSPNNFFCRLQHFFYKSANNSGTRRGTYLERPRKAHSLALLTLFPQNVLIFDLRSTVWPPESKNSKNSRFCEKCFFLITFDWVEARHSFCRHRVLLSRRVEWTNNFTLKGHVENLTSRQGHDLIGKCHVA